MGRLFALLLLVCACQPSSHDACVATSQAALVGAGVEPSYLQLGDAQAKSIVALLMLEGGQPRRLCTGTLVAPAWVLTAAHCVTNEITSASLRLGRDAQQPEREVALEIDRFLTHPTLDLALVRLPPDAIDGLAAAQPLPWVSDAPDRTWIGERVQLAGYGTDAAGHPGAREYLVEVVSDVGERFITVDGDGQSGACQGDSGGPLAVRASDGSARLAGVLHAGSASCTAFDLYTRVDLAVDWLHEQLGEQPAPSSDCDAIDAAGRCFGATAVWCAEDSLQAQHCDPPEVCGYDLEANGFRCVNATADPCDGSDDFGRCEDRTVVRCARGQLERLDCGRCTQRCRFDSASGRAVCSF